MDVLGKPTPTRWVGWIVTVIVMGIAVWAQFNIGAEVAQALRSLALKFDAMGA